MHLEELLDDLMEIRRRLGSIPDPTCNSTIVVGLSPYEVAEVLDAAIARLDCLL